MHALHDRKEVGLWSKFIKKTKQDGKNSTDVQ